MLSQTPLTPQPTGQSAPRSLMTSVINPCAAAAGPSRAPRQLPTAFASPPRARLLLPSLRKISASAPTPMAATVVRSTLHGTTWDAMVPSQAPSRSSPARALTRIPSEATGTNTAQPFLSLTATITVPRATTHSQQRVPLDAPSSPTPSAPRSVTLVRRQAPIGGHSLVAPNLLLVRPPSRRPSWLEGLLRPHSQY